MHSWSDNSKWSLVVYFCAWDWTYCKAKDKFKMAARKDIGQCLSQENWPETKTSLGRFCVYRMNLLHKILVNIEMYFSVIWSVFKGWNWKVDEFYSIRKLLFYFVYISSLPPTSHNHEFRLFWKNQLKRILYYNPWQKEAWIDSHLIPPQQKYKFQYVTLKLTPFVVYSILWRYEKRWHRHCQ